MESQNGTNIGELQKIRFLATARKISLLNLISRFQLEVIGTYLHTFVACLWQKYLQNFRLLRVIETDLKSFLRYCDKLSPWNKQTVIEYYGTLLHNDHEIIKWLHKDSGLRFKWFRSFNCFQAYWALAQFLEADNIYISIISLKLPMESPQIFIWKAYSRKTCL